MAPASLLVLLIVAGLVVAGLSIIMKALRPARREQQVCRADGCGHANPPEAVYCARCGARLMGGGRPDQTPRA